MAVSFVFKCFNCNIFPTKNKNSCVFCYKYANQMIDAFKKFSSNINGKFNS